VGDINAIADEAATNLELQNQQLIRINQSIERMDGTLTRTKRYLSYFGKSFFRDKVVLFLLTLIALAVVGNIVVATLTNKKYNHHQQQ